MYKLKETVIVEGKYDKIKLSGFLDTVIIATNGFTVFSDKRLLDGIKTMAEKTGIVILTDSDSAGFKIRSYVKQVMPPETVKHAYIPEIKGKERRKTHPGKEGILGVEGVSEELILKALRDAGCCFEGETAKRRSETRITKTDMYVLGLSGGEGSSELRRTLSAELGLPSKISANMLLDTLNRLLSREELAALCAELKE